MINGLLINQIICYFAIYSFVGWALEVAYSSFRLKRFINRGFLFGPFCPIYGYGIIMVLILLSPFASTPFYFLIGAIVVISTIEYLTGVILEAIFKAKWWDYSNQRFNLDGKICLKFSIYWGFATLFLFYFVHPYVHFFTLNLLKKTHYLFPLIFSIYLIIDTIFSIISAYSLRKIFIKVNQLKEEYKNNLGELNKKINEIYLNLKKRQQYFFRYIPNFKIPKFPHLNKK